MDVNRAVRRWVVLVAAVLTCALTARLGFWQLDRAAQKTSLQRALNEQRTKPALAQQDLARSPEQLAQQVHRAVALQGQWLPEHTVYLDNRQMNGRAGFFAVTPLLLSDGQAVLVQRGWFARDIMDRTRIVAPVAPPGMQRVVGRIALAPSRLFEFKGTHHGVIRQNLDATTFGQERNLPLLPLTVVQEDEPGAPSDGLLRQWAQPSLGVEKHQGYAFQWFALSVLTAGLWLWFALVQPRRRLTRNPTAGSPEVNHHPASQAAQAPAQAKPEVPSAKVSL